MLNDQPFVSAPVTVLDKNAVREFCEAHLLREGDVLPLIATADSGTMSGLAEAASAHFCPHLQESIASFSDPDIGISGIDIPEIYDDPTKDAITGALVAVSISQTLMPSILDKENRTPFSMFNASPANNAVLNEAGLKNISPTDILDFHSDGGIFNSRLSVPKFISIYNIFINYKRRGNFYWIPTSAIDNIDEYFDKIGTEDNYLFDLTPSVYSDRGSEIRSISANRAETAIFQKVDGRIITFMNGDFLGRSTGGGNNFTIGLLDEFKDVIRRTRPKYAVPQESRRIVILNNAHGFHARDIFEEPVEGHPYTRSYLRSASLDGYPVGKIIPS
ncbi:hypothetical protein [Rhizobium sullae]|uniref:hypothetical protein n=1 Tax=Rhizobium sullae TaxID=50338 RepID=UPI000B353BEF|nr:hypothetical protein [Rhizobium sullae]